MADPTGTNSAYRSALECVLGVKGQALSPGAYTDITIPWDCSIFRWTMVGDQAGSSVVDILVTPYDSFDDTTHPNAGDSITGGSPPTISSDVKAQDAALLGWLRSLNAGRVMRFILNSVVTQQQLT